MLKFPTPSTCTSKLVSIQKLLAEVGWEPLHARRKNHKLTLFYKMRNGYAPEYLSNLVPESVGDTSSYNLRNNNDMQSIQCRTNVYQSSFLNSVVRDWNALPENIRLSTSVSLFKKTLSNKQQVPKHFFHGERKLQILHTRIRNNCSSLNYDLHSKNTSDSPLCACGLLENAKHL